MIVGRTESPLVLHFDGGGVFADAKFLRYQPSVLATAAILLVLRAMSSPYAELLPASQPLRQLFSKADAALVRPHTLTTHSLDTLTQPKSTSLSLSKGC